MHDGMSCVVDIVREMSVDVHGEMGFQIQSTSELSSKMDWKCFPDG